MVTKDLILKSFDGRTTPMQRTLLADWLQQPANIEQYYEWLDEWERANPQFIPDTARALRRSLRRPVSESGLGDQPAPRQIWGRWLLIASVLLTLLMSGAWLLREPLLYVRHHTAFGELRTLTLPDGSRVTLNANTSLRLPRWRFSQNREVWITGEAEFSVRHLLTDQPFLVHTPDNLAIRVLGTEFVVYSRQWGSKVALSKGSIQLQSSRNALQKPLIIEPGDVVKLPRKGRVTLHHQQQMAPYTAWKDHRFIFYNTPLTEVADKVAEQFGVTVDIVGTSLAQRRLGGTFQAQSAPELLSVVAQMLNASVSQTGRQRYRLAVRTK